MTLRRAIALEKTYKSQIEDRQQIEPLPEENEMKILIFNLCREILQVYIAFAGSSTFGKAAQQLQVDSKLDQSNINKDW